MSAPRESVLQRTIPKPRLAAAVITLLAASFAAAAGTTNFSQYPGFAGFFAVHPRARHSPDARGKALLRRHRPHVMLARGQPRPIDFYRDYIANGELRDGDGRLLASVVGRAELERFADDPRVVFTHRPTPARGLPTVYGRVDRDSITLPGSRAAQQYTFLTYHLVFASSGLPAGLSGWRAWALGLVGDLDDWHQLDHYTAVTVVLDPDLHPVALLLQQHNYQHTYLLGEGAALDPHGRPVVDVALRSNELYPHAEGRRIHHAVRFADAAGMDFLLTGSRRPLASSDDVTDGEVEAGYRLEFLAPSDAFYRFAGFLGARRLLPGRDGPPGADYNTLPEFKPWSVQLFAGYWREGNAGDLARWQRARAQGSGHAGFARMQREVFFANLRCLRSRLGGCLR